MEDKGQREKRVALSGDARHSLPDFIENKLFLSARFDEIEALNMAIGDPVSKGMVFQQLPKHMRRRVMSHTVKRMPRRLREAHTRSLMSIGALDATLKRPSRRYRRRPCNLLEEYNRRQKVNVWLETHIWHAKRFHMTKKWGYCLADRPNNKSYRACYRAAANHCLLQDISFMNCIELIGPSNCLIEKLKLHTSSECGLTFGAKCFVNGTREGSVMFYEKKKYPFGAIGKIDFLWKFTLNEKESAVLWLWCHPSFYGQVLEQLISTFDLKSVCTANDSDADSEEKVKKSKKKKKNKEKLKLETKNVPFTRVPHFVSSNALVKMNLLKDTLNRFRLTGPLSNAALTSAFLLPDFQESGTFQEEDKEFTAFDWWTDYYSDKERISALSAQARFWSLLSQCASPCQVPPRSVISVTVIDPRLTLPTARIKAVPDKDVLIPDHIPIAKVDPICSASPLWNSELRDKVTETKLSPAELIKKRSSRIVPGIIIEESKVEAGSRIPIILIQRPGIQSTGRRIGLSSGWDVIVPAGWGMPFLLGLVFRGCRTGGQRETISLSREIGIPLFDEPDSKAGHINNELEKKLRLEVHFRKPPAKRLNFITMGIPTPYDFQWSTLIEEWASSSNLVTSEPSLLQNSFYVLRNRFMLDQISALLKTELRVKKVEKKIKKLLALEPSSSRSLIPMNLSLDSGGKVDKYSLICLPDESDFTQLKHSEGLKRTKGSCPTGKEIIENRHVDSNLEKRKAFRAEHKKLLAKLRRRRVLTYRKKREELANCSLSDFKMRKRKRKKLSPTAELVKEYNEKMRELWLPEGNVIKDANSRSIMGFVTNGAFCFSESLSFGQGYVSLLSLCQLILLQRKYEVRNVKVLVRNYSSNTYRFATVSLMS